MRWRSARVPDSGALQYALAAVWTAVNTAGGWLPLLWQEIRWSEVPRGIWSRRLSAAASGLLLALPILLVFGGLLASADAVFSRVVAEALRIDVDHMMSHLITTAGCAWIVGGFFRAVLLKDGTEVMAGDHRLPFRLGLTEVAIPLTLTNLLFLAFVGIQVRYLFGGADLVQATAGLTYAEYARKGFFELVVVSALVLPLLLNAHAILREDDNAGQCCFRILAGIQVALVFVIIASAVTRMRLYEEQYGLTQLRFYTTAAMGWLAAVFFWFAVTVLGGRRERFALGALAAGFAMIGALHFVNPDAYIVSSNLKRIAAGRHFDAAYAAGLSLDAAPALVDDLARLSDPDRAQLQTHLIRRRVDLDRRDWRSWSWSRHQALLAIRRHESAWEYRAERIAAR
jgi:hypothetical protein